MHFEVPSVARLQEAKVPTMTYKVLCDLVTHQVSGLSSHHSPIHHSTVAKLAALLYRHSLATGLLYLLISFPQISMWFTLSPSPGLYSNTIFAVGYSLTTFSRISSVHFLNFP